MLFRSVLTFEIKPPLWATTWARILYLLLALGAVAGVMRFYKKRLNLEYALEAERGNSRREHELNAERMRFFTNITHEFCTPLTLIQGPCEKILTHKETDIYTHRYAKMIQQNVEKLNGLIVELLEFRRLETENKMLSIQPQPVSEKLRDIAESFGDMAENREMNYCLDIAPELTWNTDLSCFNKIAGNLISNAFKYTPDQKNLCCR